MLRIAAALPMLLALPGPADQNATDAPSITTPGADCRAPATPGTLFPSIESFIDELNRADTILGDSPANWPTLDPAAFGIMPAAEVIADVLQGTDIFGGADVFAGNLGGQAIVGGLRDPATGAVETIALFGDPDGTATTAAVLAFAAMCGDPMTAADFRDTYTSVIHSGDVDAEAYVQQGSLGLTMVLTEGANPNDPLVTLMVAPADDQAVEVVEARLLTITMANLALDLIEAPAPEPTTATTPGAVTASTAPLAVTPTTGLPQVGIITAPPTTLAPLAPGATGTTAAPAPTTALAPMTTAAPVAGALFASLDDLAARWNNEVQGSPSERFVALLQTDMFALVIGSQPDGLDVFAAQVEDGPLVGGLLSPSGAVTHLVVVGGLAGFEANLAGTLTVPEVGDAVGAAFIELFDAPEGQHRYVAGTTSEVVLLAIKDSSDTTFIVVTVAALSDEATAVANADDLFRRVLETSTIR